MQGDSGGPLISENRQGAQEIVGVISWGITPCRLNKAPSVYVRVSAFTSWIKNIIENN